MYNILINLVQYQNLQVGVHSKKMFPSGIEPETFCVLGRCDNRYTTETFYVKAWYLKVFYIYNSVDIDSENWKSSSYYELIQ